VGFLAFWGVVEVGLLKLFTIINHTQQTILITHYDELVLLTTKQQHNGGSLKSVNDKYTVFVTLLQVY